MVVVVVEVRWTNSATNVGLGWFGLPHDRDWQSAIAQSPIRGHDGTAKVK
jgi:hypothetical protein